MYILNNKLSKLNWELKEIPLDKLVNPKTDLRFIRSPAFKARIHSSLLSLGIIEPIKVRLLSNGSYEILDGKTRTEDLIESGFTESIPCLVTECDDKRALTLQATFAFVRRNLDPMGMARYVKLMHDKGITLTKIGEPFNLKKAQVSKYLALNKLNREDKRRLARREITIDQGYALASKGRLPFDFKPKPTPCPYCGEFHEDYPLFRVSLCGACESRLEEAIRRERRFKQAKL